MPKLDKQDQRIANIFGTKDVPDVTTETLARYLAYLKQHLTFPCQLTGIEDWAVSPGRNTTPLDLGARRNMNNLRRREPRIRTPMNCWGLRTRWTQTTGIMVHVRRLSDKKNFLAPLSDLQATDEQPSIISCWMILRSGSSIGDSTERRIACLKRSCSPHMPVSSRNWGNPNTLMADFTSRGNACQKTQKFLPLKLWKNSGIRRF